MESSRFNKFQHQYWVTKETVCRKLGKKEDESIVASDASLDAKLELFKSIQETSSAMNKLLDRYQERICYLAQEQNSMGRFLKEFGKSDKTNAGKMMIQMGKSLIYASQQEITLRPPLLRLYQEVETFRHRAVEDTLDTIRSMERCRTEYRASLKWMKNVSQELDPDTYKQMEKFRKVQTHVKKSKGQFDKLKLACLQKVDLLSMARCNMFSHALIHYQTSTMTTTEKIAHIFSTLALTFKGYQHFEFSVIKELAEPALKPAAEPVPTSDQLLDLEKNGAVVPKRTESGKDSDDEMLLDISNETSEPQKSNIGFTAEELRSNERLLENLLGGPLDPSPDTESALEALDLTLAWPSSNSTNDSKDNSLGKGNLKKEKTKTASELLSEEFENIPFEGDSADTMSLLNELLSPHSTPGGIVLQQTPLVPSDGSGEPIRSESSTSSGGSSFLPSQLLDFGGILSQGDLLNFNATPLAPPQVPKATKGTTSSAGATMPGSTWYDIFADLDPISNPDAIGKKEEEKNRTEENRYC